MCARAPAGAARSARQQLEPRHLRRLPPKEGGRALHQVGRERRHSPEGPVLPEPEQEPSVQRVPRARLGPLAWQYCGLESDPRRAAAPASAREHTHNGRQLARAVQRRWHDGLRHVVGFARSAFQSRQPSDRSDQLELDRAAQLFAHSNGAPRLPPAAERVVALHTYR